MKEKIISQLCELLKVKSIITIIAFMAFFYLAITSRLDTDNFMLVLGMITTYFFNKDQNKEELHEESN